MKSFLIAVIFSAAGLAFAANCPSNCPANQNAQQAQAQCAQKANCTPCPQQANCDKSKNCNKNRATCEKKAKKACCAKE